MIKVYLNHYKKFFNTRVKKILFFGGIIAILSLSVTIGSVLTSNVVDVFLSGKTEVLYAALVIYLLTESIGVLLIFILLKYVTSDSSDILKVLNRLPIKPLVKYVSYYFFQVILEILLPTIFSMIILVPRLVSKGFETNLILKVSTVIIFQAIMMSLLMNFIYNILLRTLSKIKVPYPKNLSLVIQIALSIIVLYDSQKKMLLNMVNTQGVKFRYDILYWHTGFLYKSLVSNNFTPSYILLILVSVFIVVGGIFSFGLLTNEQRENGNRLLYQVVQPKTFFENLVIKDIKLTVRHEDVIFLIFTLAIAVITIRILPIDKMTYLNFLKVIVGILGSISLFSYGPELSYILTYKRLGISNYQYVISKFVSCIMLILIVDTLFCLLSFGKIEFSSFLNLYVISTLSCFFSFIIGILFPFMKNSSATQINLVVSVLALILPLNYFLKLINNLGSVEKGLVYLLLCVGIAVVANNKFNEDWNGEIL